MAKSKHKKQTNPDDAVKNAPTNDAPASNTPAINVLVNNSPASSTPAANAPTTNNPPNNTAIILALISALATIIVGFLASPYLEKWFLTEPSPPPVLLTATPVPYARVQSLEVRQGGIVIDQVNPGAVLVLTPGISIVARVNMISNTDAADLVFIWEFCHPENNARGQGAIEIPYTARMEGQDCISIKIEKGGEFLDTAHFFISPE